MSAWLPVLERSTQTKRWQAGVYTGFLGHVLLASYYTVRRGFPIGGQHFNQLRFRLTPVYWLILAVDVTLYRYLTDGPLWNQVGMMLLNYSELEEVIIIFIGNIIMLGWY